MHANLDHARYFLAILLGDNAINYPQDLKTRDWTGGYYLGNARFRLLEAYKLLPNSAEDHSARVRLLALERFEGIPRPDIWDLEHLCLTELLGRLQRALS